MDRMALTDRPGFTPGLLLLQSQRLEALAGTVIPWMGLYPPDPLDDDLVVVPSNGVGEWFKAQVATRLGICAGIRVELPARFAWRLTVALLAEDGGLAAGPNPFDKPALAWRLSARHARAQGQTVMRLEDFRWGRDVADLLDQYQIYRSDWLADWADGKFVMRRNAEDPHAVVPLPSADQWQAELWRDLLREGPLSERVTGHQDHLLHAPRPELHQRALQILRRSPPPPVPLDTLEALPGRVIVVGCGHLAPPVMELLAALSRHRRVVLAVPNPCEVHWVDIAKGAAAQEGQPLLAAWGRQVQDFVAQVEKVDNRLTALEGRAMVRPEMPLDDEQAEAAPPDGSSPARRSPSALQVLQGAIRRNESVLETRRHVQDSGATLSDPSIRFHVAHTALREVEVLHDHLLSLLDTGRAAHAGARPLQPRDVVVMVPDLGPYVPAIRAVFGQHEAGDPRRIPWGLSDQHPDSGLGLRPVLDWLLSLPIQRATLEELGQLLDCPLLQKRWGLSEAECAQLEQWSRQSGIRWGLNAAHRAGLGLGEVGTPNTWRFGVDRMLAGHAWGSAESPDLPLAVAPMAAVAGLSADAAGRLAGILARLERWLKQLTQPRTIDQWSTHIRELISDLLKAVEPDEQAALLALERALTHWQGHSQAAREWPVTWQVMHEAVMQAYEEPSPRARFHSGAVTFCTLMPLRTVPFEVVCLLGMNEGDYPRPSSKTAGDLMALPGLARAGDRSRRSDDRQLLLDALLSARRQLVVSWIGRRVQDNQEQAPSVLVGQLRDVLGAVWGTEALREVTIEHPMQPFSVRYFTEGSLPGTYAAQWQGLALARGLVDTTAPTAPDHQGPIGAPADPQPASVAHSPSRPQRRARSTQQRVERWLKHPTAVLIEDTIGAAWPHDDDSLDPDEVFALQGLQAWQARQRLSMIVQGDALAGRSPTPTSSPHTSAAGPSSLSRAVDDLLRRLQLEGRLPLGAPGRLSLEQWQQDCSGWVTRLQQAGLAQPGAVIESMEVMLPATLRSIVEGLDETPWTIPGLLTIPLDATRQRSERLLEITPREAFHASRRRGRLQHQGPRRGPVRDDVLLWPWWRQMLAAAAGRPLELVVVAPDATVVAAAPDEARAHSAVAAVLNAWQENLRQGTPWPADSAEIEAAWGSPSAQSRALDRLAQRQRAWLLTWGTASQWMDDGPAAADTGGEGAKTAGLTRAAPRPTISQWQDATERVYGHYRSWRQDQLREAGA